MDEKRVRKAQTQVNLRPLYSFKPSGGEILLMAGFPNTSAQYNYQNPFRNLVFNVNRNSCLSIRFGSSIFT